MSKAEELAKELEDSASNGWWDEAAAELRRLAEVERGRDALARHCEKLEADNAALHKSLSEQTLKAEQGWSRYENANRLSNSLQSDIVALRGKLDAIYATEPVAWSGPTYGQQVISRVCRVGWLPLIPKPEKS